jgi:hypothetical protein
MPVMTTLIILTVVLLSSTVIAILVLYAIGKIRSIEEVTRQLMASGASGEAPVVKAKGPFNGLEGKALWDMLSGKTVPEGVKADEIEQFRTQYAPVLLNSIKAAFNEGLNDGKFGQPRGNPKNDRQIKTLRVSINSWLPSHELSSLYNVGYDSARAEGDERARLRMTIVEVVQSLYGKLKIAEAPGLAESLISTSTETAGNSLEQVNDTDQPLQ